jgi:hypothetical protein
MSNFDFVDLIAKNAGSGNESMEQNIALGLDALVAHCIAEARKPDPGSDADLWRASCAKLERERRDNEATIATLRKELAAALTSEPTAPPKECPTCHGTGEVPDRHDPLGDTHPSKMERCEECDGHGVVEKQPSEAARAWRERMDEAWDAYMRFAFEAPESDSLSPEGTKVDALFDEAVALITAADQRADAHIRYERKTTDVAFARVNAERDAIQREVERSHRALNESAQRERDAVKSAERSELHASEELVERRETPERLDEIALERDAAVKRAEAAEIQRNAYRRDLLAQVHCTDAALQRAAVADSERDDLRARLAKLLAACEAFRTEEFATDNGWSLFVQAIAEARSGATDAAQAKEAT